MAVGRRNVVKLYLNRAQFVAETEKCLQCKVKPCEKACPVKCSPHDFIAAAKAGNMAEAAALIAAQNPLGETCGLICPDKFCMRACVRQNIDAPIRIPAVQAEIMRQAREQNGGAPLSAAEFNGIKIAVIGAGPSGIGATAELIKHGFAVTMFERQSTVGGALKLIPQKRLPHEIVRFEWQRLAQNPLVEAHFDTAISDYGSLLQQGFAAVIVTVGEQKSRTLGIVGEELAMDYMTYLRESEKYATGGAVAVIGGGAAAVDCALTANEQGATSVEMFVRRRLSDMRITAAERAFLLEKQVDITTMTRVTKIEKSGEALIAYTCKTRFNAEGRLEDVPHTEVARGGFAQIVLALGSVRAEEIRESENVFYAGDVVNGGSTAVEAVASGKAAAAAVAAKFGLTKSNN